MSSPPALAAWQQKYAKDIAQIASDPKLARQKLELAAVHVGRAKELLRRNEYDLALNSAENALVVSCDAVLRKDGFEVRSTSLASRIRSCRPCSGRTPVC